jgi:toxin ParE1/3/4
VKRRAVELSDAARADLLALYDRIAQSVSSTVAISYVDRLEGYIRGFDLASKRGHLREDIRPGLRIVGFKHRVTIAFTVEETRVVILRILYGGQNWTNFDL